MEIAIGSVFLKSTTTKKNPAKFEPSCDLQVFRDFQLPLCFTILVKKCYTVMRIVFTMKSDDFPNSRFPTGLATFKSIKSWNDIGHMVMLYSWNDIGHVMLMLYSILFGTLTPEFRP